MFKGFLAVVLVVLCSTPAFARPRRTYANTAPTPVRSQPVESYMSYAPSSSGANTATAQGVAEMQANAGSCRHFGGNSGYEGVGYSTVSADAAIRSCCFWGQRKPRDIGVARGRNGWYACVRYY